MEMDEFFEVIDEELPEEHVEFFERVHEGYKMGETPTEVADDLYYVIEEEYTDISYLLIMATVMGVIMSNDVPVEEDDD